MSPTLGAHLPCRQHGCPELTDGGYCVKHRGAAHQAYDAKRGTTAERGYGARHRWWRRLILSRDPVCKRCGLATSAVAHHVVALRDGGGWELENGQGVCNPCHEALGVEERSRRMGHGALRPRGE